MSVTLDDPLRRSLDGLRATDLSAWRAVLADAMQLQILRRMQGTVRHDFVSPLQGSALTFDLLRRQQQQGARDDEQRQLIMRLIDAGKAELDRFKSAISNVVDGLLVSDRDERFDLCQTVRELRLWMQNEAAFLALHLEVQGVEELWVRGRRQEVRQLLSLVMLYTIDALSPGGRLALETQKEGSKAIVRLLADGIKEPGQWGPQMFEPQWGEPRLLEGLGLFVARCSAGALGGDIDVEVHDSKNATFVLWVPGAA